MAIRRRKHIRLRGHDYREPGAYFVTVCCHTREPWLGRCNRHGMVLNEAGKMVEHHLLSIPGRFHGVHVEPHVVMPDHVHAIIWLDNAASGAGLVPVQLEGEPVFAQSGWSLGQIVGAFKSLTTNHYAAGVRARGWRPFDRRFWQRGYWDRILRTDRAVEATWNYILNNPRRYCER